MKTIMIHSRPPRSTTQLLLMLVMASAVLAGIMALTGCGGTFTLSPAGLSYTTPVIIKAPIVREK